MNYLVLAKQGVRNALGAVLYIALVGWTMNHLESVMTGAPEFVAAVFMLTLFVVSALVTGSFVLWQPLKLLVDGRKQEAGILLCMTGASLVVVLIVVGSLLVLRAQ